MVPPDHIKISIHLTKCKCFQIRPCVEYPWPLHPAPPLPGKSQCNQGPPMRAELLEQKYTTFQLPHFSCAYPHIPNPYFGNDIIPNLYFAKELRKILRGVN